MLFTTCSSFSLGNIQETETVGFGLVGVFLFLFPQFCEAHIVNSAKFFF